MKNVNYSIKASVVIILLFSTFYGCKKDLNYGYAFGGAVLLDDYYYEGVETDKENSINMLKL